MTLHLSGDVVLPVDELIAILDAKALSDPDTAAFIARAHADGRVRDIPGGVRKSVVIAKGVSGPRIFFSPISCATLARRALISPPFDGEPKEYADKSESRHDQRLPKESEEA